MKQIRQGDVLLVEVKDTKGKEVSLPGDIILMHGEATGHAHRIKEPIGKAVVLDANAERYLRVLQDVTLRHEEHSPIVLKEGKYQQVFQVEEEGEEVRRVTD